MKRFFSTLSTRIYKEAVYGTTHINPVQMHTKEVENDYTKNIIFLHDLLSSSDDFASMQYANISHSTKSNLLFYDLRGHGLTPRDTSALTHEKIRSDIIHDLYKRKKSSLTIVGHGSGGKVALSLASLHPELVKNVVLINSTPYSTVPDTIGNPQAYIYEQIVRTLKNNYSDCASEDAVLEAVRTYLSENNVPGCYEAVIMRYLKYDDVMEEYYFDYCENTTSRESLAHMQATPDIIVGDKIRCKVTAIFGENSSIYKYVSYKAMKRIFESRIENFDSNDIIVTKESDNIPQLSKYGDILSVLQSI